MAVRLADWDDNPHGGLQGFYYVQELSNNFVMFMNERGFYDVQELVVDCKHDRCCLQFSDSAGKFACGAQFCAFKELQPSYYSYLKVLLVRRYCSLKLA